MPRKPPPRSLTSDQRAQRNRQRAEDGAIAMAEYQAAAQAAIARIAVLRRKRLAKEARDAKLVAPAQRL